MKIIEAITHEDSNPYINELEKYQAIYDYVTIKRGKKSPSESNIVHFDDYFDCLVDNQR